MGCLISIPFCLPLIAIGSIIISYYLSLRRYLYGINVMAKVIKNKENGDLRDVAYSFNDKREEITLQCMPITINKFFIHHCNADYVPHEIIKLCIEYIGKSFIFWYGPYVKTEQLHYGQNGHNLVVGTRIPVKYDVKSKTWIYGKQCSFNMERRHQCCPLSYTSLSYSCLSLLVGPLIGALMWIISISAGYKWNNISNQFISMAIISTLFILIIITIWWCSCMRYCCFTKKTFKNINVNNYDDDLNQL